jgi:hypothetical protein
VSRLSSISFLTLLRLLTPQHPHIIVELPRGKRWVQWVSEILLTALLSVCHSVTLPRLSYPHTSPPRHQLLVGLPHPLSMSLSFVATCFLFLALDRATSPQLLETISGETIAILPLIDIAVDDRGNFGGWATVKNNGISELLLGTEPEFLVEFRTKLDQRRWVESDTV